MNLRIRNWLIIALVNLMVVTILGVLMRYKIAFDFPLFNQKNGQQAHSNFAFAGWITYIIYVLIIDYINSKINSNYIKHYKVLLIAMLVSSYLILFAYLFVGYSIFTNAVSAIIFIIACFFTYFFFKDFARMPKEDSSKIWFKAAMIFNLISTAGVVNIAIMMFSHTFNDKEYLASLYYYLHFQYNGFFIFACFGFVFNKIFKLIPDYKHNLTIFYLTFISAFPTYFLSTLWAGIPTWLYIIVIVGAVLQIIAWIILMIDLSKIKNIHKYIPSNAIRLALFICVAYSIKLGLQLGSTIPIVSKLAFGFRPIVIAYLHLVLLAVISLFLISYLFAFNKIKNNRLTTGSIIILAIGIFTNELILGIQGIASFKYISIPFINEMLFGVSIVLLVGAILLIKSQSKKSKNEYNTELV